MIEIKKNNEPNKLANYRRENNATYADMPKDVKAAVLESLMNEQGHLCAYCMKRIPVRHGYLGATIEHIQPQNETGEDERLKYRNMLAVCPGNRDATDDGQKTCDARRGSLPKDKQSLIVNPLKKETLSSINYHENGIIYSTIEDVDKDLNHKLNLNCESLLLPDTRASALQELQKKVNQDNPGRIASKEYFRDLLSKYSQYKEKRTPYVGILINWLEKKAK